MLPVRRISVPVAALGILLLGSVSSLLHGRAQTPVPVSLLSVLSLPAPVTLTPAGDPALANAREPQVAADRRGGVYVTFGAGDTLYCAVSPDGGKGYRAPVRVGEAGHLSLGMRRGPRIAVAGKTVVISAIYGREGGGRDGDLLAWRSADGGKTWQGPAAVNDVPGAAREGLHAMAAAPDGKTVACAWLDLRGRGTRIYLSLSRDGGATWTTNTRVYESPDGTVCECCHPSIAFGPRNEIVVMWRNALGGARDMYLARSADGGAFGPARKIGRGTWPLKACPMDGGALAVAPDGTVTTIWRRDQEMFTCVPGDDERLLGRGQQGWIAAAGGGADGGVYAVWLQGRPGKLLARLPGSSEPVVVAENANDPVVAAAPNGKGAIVTWMSAAGPEQSSVQATLLTPRR